MNAYNVGLVVMTSEVSQFMDDHNRSELCVCWGEGHFSIFWGYRCPAAL